MLKNEQILALKDLEYEDFVKALVCEITEQCIEMNVVDEFIETLQNKKDLKLDVFEAISNIRESKINKIIDEG